MDVARDRGRGPCWEAPGDRHRCGPRRFTNGHSETDDHRIENAQRGEYFSHRSQATHGPATPPINAAGDRRGCIGCRVHETDAARGRFAWRVSAIAADFAVGREVCRRGKATHRASCSVERNGRPDTARKSAR